ncbi:hypothetical protein OC834_005371 [Tilletia horrida]|nr:hypothetical protein OC834_005371 [Tilletia horrida]
MAAIGPMIGKASFMVDKQPARLRYLALMIAAVDLRRLAIKLCRSFFWVAAIITALKRSAPTDKKDSDVDKDVELVKARAAKHTKTLPFRIRPENFKELSKERFESLTKRLIELELVVQDDSQRWTWKH